MTRRHSISATRPSGCARFLIVPFGAVFLAAGLFFEGLIARDFLKTAAPYAWDKTPCVMLASEVKPDPEQTWPNQDYLVQVGYRYTAGGQERTSTNLSEGKRVAFSDYGEAQRLADRLAEGARTVCYVNPEDPGQSVLRRGSLWSGLLLLFPLIFVALGSGLMWAGLRAILPASRTAQSLAKTAPLSEKTRVSGRGVLVLVFGVFFVLGASMTHVVLLGPTLKVLEARSWPATPCRVLASGVRSHRGDKSTTYSVHILYAYDHEGRPHQANHYSFFGGSSSGHARKAAVVNQYPAGRQAQCFVNPKEPTEAVLHRGFTAAAWVGLVPLAFALVGAGGLYGVFRRREGSPSTSLRQAMGDTDRWDGVVEDTSYGETPKSASGPWGKFIGSLLAALFWNGIVSVFVWQLIVSARRNDFEWGLALFLIPFVLIGLLLVAFVLHSLLALFNPRPRLLITPPDLVPGGSVDVQWQFSGRTRVLRRVKLRLKGREQATCRHGGKVTTEKREFAVFDVADTTARGEMASGQARFKVPKGLMHSWKAPHYRIVWVLQVQAVIKRWPDVDQEFVVNMKSALAARSKASEAL